MPRPKRIEDDDLLKIARAIFVREGPHGSTREIAQRAGISEAALFKRFATKAELFIAAMMPPPVDVEAMIAAAKRVADPQMALAVFGDHIVAYLREAIPVVRQLTQTPLVELDDVRRGFGAEPAEEQITRSLAAWIAGEAERGRLRCSNPMGAAMLLFAALHSLVLFEVMQMHVPRDGAAMARAMIAALWDGLTPERTELPNDGV
jgi:AcrR family transcriptional regulator